MNQRGMAAAVVTLVSLGMLAAAAVRAQGPPGSGGSERPNAHGPGPGDHGMPPPGMGPPGRGGPPLGARPDELDRVGMSDAQRTAFATLRQAEEQTCRPLEAEARRAMLRLDALLDAEHPDAQAIDTQLTRFTELRHRILAARVTTVLGQYARLSPAQREPLRRMREARPAGEPGPPPPPSR